MVIPSRSRRNDLLLSVSSIWVVLRLKSLVSDEHWRSRKRNSFALFLVEVSDNVSLSRRSSRSFDASLFRHRLKVRRSLNSRLVTTIVKTFSSTKSTSPPFLATVRIKPSRSISIESSALLWSTSSSARIDPQTSHSLFSSSQSSSSPIQINDADCLPRGYSANYTRDNRAITITGEGDFQSCAQALVTLLNLNTTCKRKPCSLNGIYQPSINYEAHDFYGFSEFWYTMEGIVKESEKCTCRDTLSPRYLENGW